VASARPTGSTAAGDPPSKVGRAGPSQARSSTPRTTRFTQRSARREHRHAPSTAPPGGAVLGGRHRDGGGDGAGRHDSFSKDGGGALGGVLGQGDTSGGGGSRDGKDGGSTAVGGESHDGTSGSLTSGHDGGGSGGTVTGETDATGGQSGSDALQINTDSGGSQATSESSKDTATTLDEPAKHD
jgi:hypothetical protein